MEKHEAIVNNTPLLVNFLRLIRNGRQEQGDIAYFGIQSLVPFPFGGLRMLDLGVCTEAESLWFCMAQSSHSEEPRRNQRLNFAGPLYLVITYDDVVLEEWELVDYRDSGFENSLPSSCDQLEELNTLVRIIYTYLRIHDVRRNMLQSLLQEHDNVYLDRDWTSHKVEKYHTSSKSTGMRSSMAKKFQVRIYGHKEEFPQLGIEYTRAQRWCIADLIRITVTTNALVYTQLLAQRERNTPRPDTRVVMSAREINPLHTKDDSIADDIVHPSLSNAQLTRRTSAAQNTSQIPCNQLVVSPCRSSNSQESTPPLERSTVLMPTYTVLTPSLFPHPTAFGMAPLALPQGTCATGYCLLVNSTTPSEAHYAGSSLLIVSPSSQVMKSGAKALRPTYDDTPYQIEVRGTVPPDFVRRMASSLFHLKNSRTPEWRWSRSTAIALDTMAALPLGLDDQSDNEKGSSLNNSSIPDEDISTRSSAFDLLELTQQMHGSLALSQQAPLRDLVLSLQLQKMITPCQSTG